MLMQVFHLPRGGSVVLVPRGLCGAHLPWRQKKKNVFEPVRACAPGPTGRGLSVFPEWRAGDHT